MPQPKWSDNGSSAKYITNEMLQPFIKSPMCTTQIEMTLSCTNLINMDIVTKSDPYCVIYMKESWQEKYHEVARTECIDDTLNPEWVKKLIINYNFETIQYIQFEVRDQDANDTFDLLGTYETKLSDLVAYSSRQFIGRLAGKSKRTNYGEIVIVTEELSNCKQIVDVQFRAENLRKLSWICNNDPFLVIYRSNEDGSYSVVAKTDTVYSTQNPVWKPIVMRARSLCNGDEDRSIKIDCYDNRTSGSHKLIGTCYTSLRTLNTAPLTLTKNKGPQNSSVEVGQLRINKIHITEEVTFLDYIRNGTQMHFAVAIDFTASNGVVSDPQSLHYLCPNRPNNYEIALRSVGEIIQHYDSSQLFPAFGFGAKLPPNGHISHQFPLNGNLSHPYCAGVDEILFHYRNSLNTVQLYGPTNFAPVINNTISIAANFQDGKHYFVLLIITDGIISDMHHTKRAIINASVLPISIIIVGVGNSDFGSMDELDSDDVRLSVDGRYAERDIVQFVPLNKYLANAGLAYIKSQADLAKEVLAEIPYQLTSFMESKNYKPTMPTKNHQADTSALAPTAPLPY